MKPDELMSPALRRHIDEIAKRGAVGRFFYTASHRASIQFELAKFQFRYAQHQRDLEAQHEAG